MGGIRSRPRVTVGRILPNDLIIKIKQLLLKYKEIPLMQVPTLFYFDYEEYLDAGTLGFDNGLTGLFGELKDLVDITLSKEGLEICSLSEQCKPKLIANRNTNSSTAILKEISIQSYVKSVHDRRREKNLFDGNDVHLWRNKINKLLKYDLESIHIAQSPLELAIERSPSRMMFEIKRIHKFMSQYPQGIKLNEIYSLYQLDKRLFNSTAYAELVEEYPELFYLVRSSDEDEEPLIFDGVTNTYNELDNHDLKNLGYTSSVLVYQTIVSGVYQKTLLLLRKAGKDGLKLSVWRQSLKSNFLDVGIFDMERYNRLLSLEPLTLFLNLTSFGLVELKSHKNCKNDIRIHFPAKKMNFKELLADLEQDILFKIDRHEEYVLKLNSSTRDENNNDS